jgi:hypothetical protein
VALGAQPNLDGGLVMRAPIWRHAILTASLCLLPRTTGAQRAPVSFPGSDVALDLDSATAKLDTYLGRPALLLRGQSPPALIAGIDASDGTIEFDLSAMPNANFFGLVFRYADAFNHENIYFRLHRSGSFEAVQYAPRVNSAAGSWQIYREFMAQATLPVGAWVHVRAEFGGEGLRLFVGDSTKPLISVPRLRGITTGGRIGLWGRVNDRPEAWTAAISNLRVRARPAVRPAAVDTAAVPAGTLTGWQVAGPYEVADSSASPRAPAETEWSPIALEEGGLLNISKRLRKPRGGRHVAFLRNVVDATGDEIAALDLGYSDDAMVWLNGAPVFRGFNGFNSRYPGFLGLLDVSGERVFLRLRPGENVLVIAVGERTFGWGMKARLTREAAVPAAR